MNSTQLLSVGKQQPLSLMSLELPAVFWQVISDSLEKLFCWDLLNRYDWEQLK